jgi:hypothetical protein
MLDSGQQPPDQSDGVERIGRIADCEIDRDADGQQDCRRLEDPD